jgi:hypothetical protein
MAKKVTKKTPAVATGSAEFLLFKTEDQNIAVDVRLEDETVWLTQEQMASLFGKGRTTITEHIKHIFEEGELDEKVVCRDFRHTTQHGAIEGKTQKKSVKHYNLDVIISVGYRVKSLRGTQFRRLSEAAQAMTRQSLGGV